MGIGESIPQSSEMVGGPGFRVRRVIERVPPEVVDRFRSVEPALVSDLMNRLYTMTPGCVPIVPPDTGLLVGPVCAVKVFPGDNLMVHAALDVAQPGDVVVVDTAGSMINAVLGDMVANKARARGIAGFVVDGLVRDVAGMLEARVPVFARGATPRGPLHRGPGELNYPIACGGVSVSPGDLVMADADGVIFVPRDCALDVLERAEKRRDNDADYAAAVKRGEFSNEWVRGVLEDNGCEFPTS
jgi:RraA family protein